MNGFVKSFVFPFLAALIIFSVIAVAALPPILRLVFVSDESDAVIENESEFSDNFVNTLNSKANGVLSLMLICTENTTNDSNDTGTDVDNGAVKNEVQEQYNKIINNTNVTPTKNIKFITVAIFDSILNRVSVTYIPPETQVTVKGAKTDLDTVLCYIENGNDLNITYDYFTDFALSVTGFKPDIYGFVDIKQYIKIADTFKDLTVMMNESINIRSSNGVIKPYRAGTLTSVSSSDLYNIITCDNYVDNSTKATILESLSLSVLDKITTLSYYSEAEDAFSRCISSLAKTNASYDIFSEKSALFFSYKLYSHMMINLIGETNKSTAKTVFIPNKNASVELFKK